MKKLIAVVVACLGLAVAAQAQGIEAGDHMFSMMIGAGAPLQDSGLKDDGGKEVDWADGGAIAGLSYMVFPSEYWGLGLEVNDGIFADEKTKGIGWEEVHGMNVLNAMVSMRFNLNPDSRARLYIPFGAGLTTATGIIETKNGGTKEDKTATYNSFGWFVGVGFEIALGSQGHWSLGAEGRYNAFSYDTDKLMEKVGDTGVGKKDYSYLSAVFKASYRF